MTPETQRCPVCGLDLPLDAPGGLCPACLMKQGLENTVDLLSGDPAGEACGHAGSPGEAERSSREFAVSLEVGRHFGPYRIVRLLGKGGMGAVYEAVHTESGRRVALKVLGHALESSEARRRFLREGRLAASVNHPNSVYVFGTEEVNGTPVIAMELVSGGTLEDRVKRDGPLLVGEAVDVILQISAGLEAAQAVGVLHRDIKPSNCFVDSDGTVKVGDFGLSVSTEPRGETNLTASGLFLGTPAFSSPEQLRGDELDIRSDIYSLGVTLYYLLTGRTPFQGKQMVHLLATVLEQPAPSPATLRHDIPKGLAGIVVRCLAKGRAERFASYDDLHRALLPYASTAPTPGTLGFRVLASGIDFLVFSAAAALVPLLWFQDVDSWHQHFQALSEFLPRESGFLMLLTFAAMAFTLGYFGILEGIWGASVGKAICGLRVRCPDRGVAGLPRAFLRAVLYHAPLWLPIWAIYAIDPGAAMAGLEGVAGVVSAFLLLLWFSTIRRRNGYAGIHELLSGTRVVRTPFRQARPGLPASEEPLPELEGREQIGSYHVLARLGAGGGDQFLLGYDTRLLRKVWIRKLPAGEQPLAPTLRNLARVGRLRWLNGQRAADDCWDAYEAPSGKPFLSLIGERQPWAAVRFWLLDLAEELSAGLKDGTGPALLDLDRLWITAAGRAKLLDFAAPGIRSPQPMPEAPQDSEAVQLFLKRVAIAALTGVEVSPDEARTRPVAMPLPLQARKVLNGLGASAEAEIPVNEFRELVKKPAAVSLQRRLGILAGCWLPLFFMIAFGFFMHHAERQFFQKHPDLKEFSECMSAYEGLIWADKLGLVDKLDKAILDMQREALEIYIASRFRKTLSDTELWSDPRVREVIGEGNRKLAEKFVAAHRNPSPEGLAAATEFVKALLNEQRQIDQWVRRWLLLPDEAIGGLIVLFGVVVATSLIWALLFGDGLLLRCLEIAVVNRKGDRASRIRLLGRNAFAWLAGFLLFFLLAFLLYPSSQGAFRVLLIYLILRFGIWHLFAAERTVPDKLFRTWLVPR